MTALETARLELVKPGSPLDGTHRPDQPALSLVSELCSALAAEGVVYCHWKSNNALDRSARGENDLDLLVSRADERRFAGILSQLGFKEARLPADRQLPGILDYYGYDPEASQFVHVHAHYQLIMGDDMTKNYRLPIERPYLESAVQAGLFRVPSPEFEFMVLVIRMVLKHSSWDAILSLQGSLPASARRELAYLQNRIDRPRLYELLRQHVPFIGQPLFDRCLDSLRPDCRFWTRVKVGQQLQRALQAHACRSQASDTYLKLWRRASRAVRQRIFRRRPRKRLAQGGAMIALVGGDGAGKSTAVEELHAWLSKDFDVIQVHLGKPAWSWTTIIVRGLLKLGRLLGLFPYRKSSPRPPLDSESPVFPGYPWLLRTVCTARDRYRAYVKARRFATNGGLVLCDRFPLPPLLFMDGPQIAKMTAMARANRLVRFLMELEHRYYRHILLPDLLIVLRLDPEIAVQRRTDEEATSVRARGQEIWELEWQKTPARVINAGRPKAEVLSALKSLVWSEL